MSEYTGPGPIALLEPSADRPVGERLQQAADRLAYLSRVARGLSAAMHTERAVDLVLEMLAGPVVDWAQVTRVERHSYVFRARHVDSGPVSDLMQVGEVDQDSSLGRVLASGVSDLVLVPDGQAPHSTALVSAVPSEELRSRLTSIQPMDLLSLPLTARGTTYGALTVARRGGSGFDEAAIAFLEDFAQRVSVTIDATRALAESRRVARVLSRDLNPPSLPVLAGTELAQYYRVAYEHDAVGGDFFDVHGDDQEWTAVMGDVCGKGVEAAVLTGKVRQSVRTAALVDRDPAAVLALANRALLADQVDTFVSAVCARGRRDGDDLLLDIASAGHPSPLLVRRDGSVEDVEVGGTVLGLLPTSDYQPVQVRLAPAETCVFYTDGVTEAPGHRERFGEQRLREVLADTGCCAVPAQVEALAMALTAHLQDREHDDIAILAVQSRPEQP